MKYFKILSVIPVILSLAVTKVWAQEPYAVLSDNNTVLTFYYDDQKDARGGMSVGPFTDVDESGWYDSRESITTAVFDDSFADCTTLTSTACWFGDCRSIVNIEGISNLKTDNVTNMSFMFLGCSSLTSLDVSGFNTSNVSNMIGMFQLCSGLTSLDVSNFNTENVTVMFVMFSGCSGLTSLDLSNFNTANVTEMGVMFSGCSGLTSLDLSSFNTENVGSMSRMFEGCSNLTSLDVSNFDTSKVTDMSSMFYGCSSLTSLDVSGFNTSNVTNMSSMFFGCSGLTSLDVSGFNTENVTGMGSMFRACSGLQSLDVSGFNTENVTNMSYMFWDCSSLTSLDVSGFNTSNVTDMGGMFFGCSGLTSLDVSGFNTENVTGMGSMFGYCFGLTSLDVSGFNTSNVTYIGSMFSNCSALTSLDLSSFNTSNVTSMDGMFQYCSSLTSLDISSFNTENVTDMGYMFYRCSGLTSLDVSNFNTAKVGYMDHLFEACSGLTSLDVSNFNTENVTRMTDMFALCSNLSTIYVSDQWSTDAVTNGVDMFKNCTNLVGGAGTTYDPDHTDYTYAHIDGGENNPGYFTSKDAPTEIYAPYFNFEGDNLTMTSDTQGAIIFYAMEGYSTEDEANDLRDNMTVDTQNTLYQDPIPVTTNVVVKAIAFVQGQGMSDVTTLVYDYDAWQGLLQTMAHGEDVLSRSDITMPNDSLQGVLDDLRNDLTWMLDESRHFYQERAMMDSYEANHFAMEIQNVCNKIEELLNEYSPSEPYAVLSDNNTVLTFYYDDQKDARGGMSVGPFGDYPDRGWNAYSPDIQRVVFSDSFADYRPEATNHWFYNMNNLTVIEGIENLHTERVESMQGMFHHCYNLQDLDVSGFNTMSVTNMWGVFEGCRSLTTLDVSSFDTSNAVTMESMFRECSSLTTLDLRGFHPANVTNFYAMFKDCSSLVSVDLRNFNTPWVSNWELFFDNCSSLSSIQASYANIPQEVYASIENPNLLVYVNEPSLAPQSVTNVVVDGHAPLIVLTDTEDGNNNWYCPEPFYADSIVYTHDYRMTTQIGVSRGWETIALPFNVQNIRHEKNGALAPFGSGLAGKPFWLRTLSHQGLVPAERIEANVPYLISMPNNALYLSEYNQAGTVTFSASNTEVYMTEQWGMESNDRVLMPAFQRVAPQSDVYAVNRNAAYGNYPEGSVFVASYREVRPFEAYTLHPNGGAKLLTIDDLMNGDTDDIDIHEMMPADNVKVYDLSGVLIKSGNANEVMKQLPRGIYIVNGMKVVK